MKMQIVECPKCAAKNRISTHSDGLKPICGRCGAALFQENHKPPIHSPLQKPRFSTFLTLILITLIAAVICGIIVTPNLMHKDFSLLIAAEAQKTKLLKKQHEDEFAAKKGKLEKELATIDAQDLQRKATQNYKGIFEARKSFDKRFALSPREKAQLRMRNLSSDSTKSFHDAIRSVAQEASPDGADISVHESSKGIALHIDFDMSSITSGEHGTRTKHHSKDSLRKEVVSLISRVTNDIFQFCKGLNIGSIYVGCRHYVTTSYPDSSTKEENMILYKIRIQANQIPHLTSDPFLDTYSTTKYLKVDEDNFDEIEIIFTRI
jgi:ribosomal protein S27AE